MIGRALLFHSVSHNQQIKQKSGRKFGSCIERTRSAVIFSNKITKEWLLVITVFILTRRSTPNFSLTQQKLADLQVFQVMLKNEVVLQIRLHNHAFGCLSKNLKSMSYWRVGECFYQSKYGRCHLIKKFQAVFKNTLLDRLVYYQTKYRICKSKEDLLYLISYFNGQNSTPKNPPNNKELLCLLTVLDMINENMIDPDISKEITWTNKGVIELIKSVSKVKPR